MRIEQFEVKQLDELMLFLDESLNENYERVVFLNIHIFKSSDIYWNFGRAGSKRRNRLFQ